MCGTCKMTCELFLTYTFLCIHSYILNDGRFFRSPVPLLLFLPKILPNTFETLFTPNFRRIGKFRSNCTARASRNNDWNAKETPAKFSAALTS